jgi:hypothetical protein
MAHSSVNIDIFPVDKGIPHIAQKEGCPGNIGRIPHSAGGMLLPVRR